MRIRYIASITALILLAASVSAPSAASATPSAGTATANPPTGKVELRQQAIHLAYNEGDFDKVLAEIEAFTAANRFYSRADSIFIAKHLAVVHTANPNTREKGKYYMFRLLEMVPSAELVDMFVSDEIDRIFDKVRREFLARQHSFGVDTTQLVLPAKPSGQGKDESEPELAAFQASEDPPPHVRPVPDEEGKPFWRKRGVWVAGGAGLAAVGAVAAYMYIQSDQPQGKTINIPSETTP